MFMMAVSICIFLQRLKGVLSALTILQTHVPCQYVADLRDNTASRPWEASAGSCGAQSPMSA